MPFVTVLHLTTGHVLAAISSGGLEPTIAELTGDKPLPVRFKDPELRVDVPVELLKLATGSTDDDVLDRPDAHLAVGGNPAVTVGGPPLDVPPGSVAAGPPSAEYIIVSQVDDEPHVATGTLDAAGTIPPPNVPGADCRLIALKGGALIRQKLP